MGSEAGLHINEAGICVDQPLLDRLMEAFTALNLHKVEPTTGGDEDEKRVRWTFFLSGFLIPLRPEIQIKKQGASEFKWWSEIQTAVKALNSTQQEHMQTKQLVCQLNCNSISFAPLFAENAARKTGGAHQSLPAADQQTPDRPHYSLSQPTQSGFLPRHLTPINQPLYTLHLARVVAKSIQQEFLVRLSHSLSQHRVSERMCCMPALVPISVQVRCFSMAMKTEILRTNPVWTSRDASIAKHARPRERGKMRHGSLKNSISELKQAIETDWLTVFFFFSTVSREDQIRYFIHRTSFGRLVKGQTLSINQSEVDFDFARLGFTNGLWPAHL